MLEFILVAFAIVVPAIMSLVFLWLLVAPLFGYRSEWLNQQQSTKNVYVQNNTFFVVNVKNPTQDQHDPQRLNCRK